MATKGTRVSVAVTVTKLNTTGSDSVSGSSLLVRNRGAASIFLGASDVTTATGYEVLADESLPVDIDAGEDLYAICASGTVACHVLEVGV